MRPDSVEIPPEPLKPESLARVRATRQKERDERQKAFGDLARERKRRGQKREEPEKPAESGENGDGASAPTGGQSPTSGHRLDLLV